MEGGHSGEEEEGDERGAQVGAQVAYLKGRILEVDSNLAVVKDLGRGHLGLAPLHRAVNGIDPQPGRLEVLPGEFKHASGRAHRELVPSLALDPELLVGLLPRDRVLFGILGNVVRGKRATDVSRRTLGETEARFSRENLPPHSKAHSSSM